MKESKSVEYKTLINSLPQKLFFKDTDLVYTACNENYSRDMNLTPEEMVGKDDYAFYPRELADKYRADDRAVMESGQMREIEESYVVDGKTFWVQTIKTPVVDDSGEVKGILGVFWDITEKKYLKEELEVQRNQFLTVIEHFPEILYVTDPDTYEVLFVNRKFRELLGSDPVGKKCYETFQGFSEPCEFCTNDIILKTREPYHWEYYNPMLKTHYQITDQIIKWADGRDVRFESAIDVTARKKAEDELKEHRDNLEKAVEKRTAELQESNEKLQHELEAGKRREEVIKRQAGEIMELSTPVIQVWKGIVIAPLIGTIDSRRTQLFMDRLLTRITETKSPVALIDITGVPTLDTQTAQHLIEAVTAATLLGTKVLITGISPVIAQTIIHLGIDLSAITTKSSLAAGLIDAFDFMNLHVVPRSAEEGR